VSDTPVEYALQRSTIPDVWETIAPPPGVTLDLPTAKALHRGAIEHQLDGAWRVVERPLRAPEPWRTKDEAAHLRRQADAGPRPGWSS
jgi:hypothetical protein